jgi:hypothetical protein
MMGEAWIAAGVGAALGGSLLVYTCCRVLASRPFRLLDLVVVAFLFANVAAVCAVGIINLVGERWEMRLLWLGGLAIALVPCMRGAGWAVGEVSAQNVEGPARAGWVAAGFLAFPACVLACALPAEIAMLAAPEVHEFLWLAILVSGLSAMLVVRLVTFYLRGRKAGAGAGRQASGGIRNGAHAGGG